MKIYGISLAVGVLVGVIYSLLQVRSPAPPLVALVGLLGILIGEQVVPVGRQILIGNSLKSACADQETVSHVLGQLPGRNTEKKGSHGTAG
jgi:XapX domain-containing protein